MEGGRMKKILILLCVLFLFLGFVNSANAGRIVLANDEWTLSNRGFSTSPDAGTFATNVADWFTGGTTGNFLAYTNNFGFTESQLSNAMTSAGHAWTVSTAVSFDLTTLLNYDGIFLGGYAADNSVLTAYVNAGGNVYLAGGTATLGTAAQEAATWNPFLNNFGLGYGDPWNGVSGDIFISSLHPIFNNVESLYQNNGNDALDINILDPNAEVLVYHNEHGLYAVYDPVSQVPEPGTMLLFGTGLIGLAGLRRRFKK